ncbi:Ras association domain protein [Dictyocaulus viviparus]|uniref:Ras association domain protein n=1 Tax=Dictyocaulus viviparus TaxID=29172 RepID=A0A0D8Y1V5_DICVI|nr:Ras association domain protein [Dictyocaulus viviparus]
MNTYICSTASSTTTEGDDASGGGVDGMDSDEEDDDGSCPSHESFVDLKDSVRECLEKEPCERNAEDLAVLLDFMQHMSSFAPLPMSIKRQLCLKMVFAVVNDAGTVVMHNNEKLDAWSVIVNGLVEVVKPNGERVEYKLGDSFGAEPNPAVQYHIGEMRTMVDDCEFVLIEHKDFCSIMSTIHEHIEKDCDGLTGEVPDRLIQHLIDDRDCNVDPHYVDDFLLTYRVFIHNPTTIFEKLMMWFAESSLRDKGHISLTVNLKSNILGFKELLGKTERDGSKVSSKNKALVRVMVQSRGSVPHVIPVKTTKAVKIGMNKTSMMDKLMTMLKSPKESEDNTDEIHTGASHLRPSRSNPDIASISQYYEPVKSECPEHVLKIYRSDQTFKYLAIYKETTAQNVVQLALQEFNMTAEGSLEWSLCECTVTEDGVIKQRRLPPQIENLAERIALNSRYYLKNNNRSEPLVPDELAPEIIKDSQAHLLGLNAQVVAAQLTLQDFAIFASIEPTEYIDNLFQLESRKYIRMLENIQQLVDPSRNMSKYRQHLAEVSQEPPVVPIYPVIRKDLTFSHEGNPTYCGKLVNFEKLRIIAKSVRAVTKLSSAPYEISSMAERIYEQALMVRKVKSYLESLRIVDTEADLDRLSFSIEPQQPVTRVRRAPSPSPSSLSSQSGESISTDQRRFKSGGMFGVDSPQAVQKMLGLVQTSKSKGPSLVPSPVPPISMKPFQRGVPRQHSNPGSHRPPPLLKQEPVDLSKESSSVTSFYGAEVFFMKLVFSVTLLRLALRHSFRPSQPHDVISRKTSLCTDAVSCTMTPYFSLKTFTNKSQPSNRPISNSTRVAVNSVNKTSILSGGQISQV